MFQNAGKNYTPFVFQKKASMFYLVPHASLVGSLELSNVRKNNVLEFVYSATDGNYVLPFLMSWILLEAGPFSVMYHSKHVKA